MVSERDKSTSMTLGGNLLRDGSKQTTDEEEDEKEEHEWLFHAKDVMSTGHKKGREHTIILACQKHLSLPNIRLGSSLIIKTHFIFAKYSLSEIMGKERSKNTSRKPELR